MYSMEGWFCCSELSFPTYLKGTVCPKSPCSLTQTHSNKGYISCGELFALSPILLRLIYDALFIHIVVTLNSLVCAKSIYLLCEEMIINV